MENIETLVEAGLAGIALALIGVIIFIVRIFMKHLANHAQHQTDATNKNTEATIELKGAVKELSIHIKRNGRPSN